MLLASACLCPTQAAVTGRSRLAHCRRLALRGGSGRASLCGRGMGSGSAALWECGKAAPTRASCRRACGTCGLGGGSGSPCAGSGRAAKVDLARGPVECAGDLHVHQTQGRRSSIAGGRCAGPAACRRYSGARCGPLPAAALRESRLRGSSPAGVGERQARQGPGGGQAAAAAAGVGWGGVVKRRKGRAASAGAA